LISEVVDEHGTSTDFIGHAGGDNFIIISMEDKASLIKQRLKERFAEEVLTHYNFIDRQQGYIVSETNDGPANVPFMTLSVGIISPNDQPFADIREITELAAEARRKDTADESRV
jgi:GGDEF domain-containing protein